MTRSRSHHSRPARVPNFESGVIEEPLLHFGGRHGHVDPKTGLALYGPYSLAGQPRPPITSISVGIVGPPGMVADAVQWLSACRGMLTNDGRNPFLYPHFPGFNPQHPFQCDLVWGDSWREVIRDAGFQAALDEGDFHERVRRVVRLYINAIEVLSQRDPQPSVILCCIPQPVINQCTVRTSWTGGVRAVRDVRVERIDRFSRRRLRNRGQLSLFPELFEDEDAGPVHRNLRRGIKAEAMRYGIPTQLAWPNTLRPTDVQPVPGERRVQDLATRAWNFVTALYHKAGGSPWRVAELEPGVCFIGISFYREIMQANPLLRTSMAQAFTAAGDGYVLRGNTFEWDESARGRSPHLDATGAAALMRDVLDLYQRQSRGGLPSRVVLHKTSRFTAEELAGFRDACTHVPRTDFVTLGSRGIQFYRTGDYPPLRGTYVKFSTSELLLYTKGYVPYLRTYPGARVPEPVEVLEHHGDSPWNVVLQEVLALTKMNWNTADFSCHEPVTIAFSRRVGQILAELPPDGPVRPEYRFYM